jgi:hypothetical protein
MENSDNIMEKTNHLNKHERMLYMLKHLSLGERLPSRPLYVKTMRNQPIPLPTIRFINKYELKN